RVVRLRLDDGREVEVSPGHPLADGRPVESITTGMLLDGARVLDAELVPYRGSATYDLLPDGLSGTYLANGIPLRSTLVREPEVIGNGGRAHNTRDNCHRTCSRDNAPRAPPR